MKLISEEILVSAAGAGGGRRWRRTPETPPTWRGGAARGTVYVAAWRATLRAATTATTLIGHPCFAAFASSADGEKPLSFAAACALAAG